MLVQPRERREAHHEKQEVQLLLQHPFKTRLQVAAREPAQHPDGNVRPSCPRQPEREPQRDQPEVDKPREQQREPDPAALGRRQEVDRLHDADVSLLVPSGGAGVLVLLVPVQEYGPVVETDARDRMVAHHVERRPGEEPALLARTFGRLLEALDDARHHERKAKESDEGERREAQDLAGREARAQAHEGGEADGQRIAEDRAARVRAEDDARGRHERTGAGRPEERLRQVEVGREEYVPGQRHEHREAVRMRERPAYLVDARKVVPDDHREDGEDDERQGPEDRLCVP